jgi:hypothetical protein
MWASLLRTRFKERNVRHPKSSGHPAKSHNEGNSSRVTSESETILFRANCSTVHSGLAQLLVVLRYELLNQFNHFVGVFFVLNLSGQIAPIARSR